MNNTNVGLLQSLFRGSCQVPPPGHGIAAATPAKNANAGGGCWRAQGGPLHLPPAPGSFNVSDTRSQHTVRKLTPALTVSHGIFSSLLALTAIAFAGCGSDPASDTFAEAQSGDAKKSNDASDPIAGEDATSANTSVDVTIPTPDIDFPAPAAPASEALAAEAVPITHVPCNADAGEFPANLARHPTGGIVGTCSTFSGASSKWFRVFPPDLTPRLIADNLSNALDETLVLPDGSFVATIPDKGALRYAPLPAPHLANELAWSGATYVKGLAYDDASQVLAIGASMLDFVTSQPQPGRLQTYAINGDTATPACHLDNTGGENFTSLGVATLSGETYWVGVNSGRFGPNLEQSTVGSLVFLSRNDCMLRRSVDIPGSLGIAGKLSIRSDNTTVRIALPSARNEPHIYIATVTGSGASPDITDAAATPVTLETIAYPESIPSAMHFTNSAEFGPLGTSIFTCDVNQQRCWQLTHIPQKPWTIAHEYVLTGNPTNAVWGPEGVWLVDGSTLQLIPTAPAE